MSNEWYDIDSWQWTDDDVRQWGFSEEGPGGPAFAGLRQIWTDDKYVYAATTSGLEIINIETEQRQSFATNPTGYTSVWSDNTQVFLGSTTGVKVLAQSAVGPAEILSQLDDYAREPDLTSNDVKYVHGNLNKLICCTVEGVDILWRNSTGYRTYTTVTGAQKCFATQNNYFYYTVSGTAPSGIVPPWYLCRLNDSTGNWDEPDVLYTTGSGFLAEATCLVDFYVTEHTSISGANNTLFVATDAGVYVYDEGADRYTVFTTVS
jgi:hypothetical protein